MLFLSDIKYIRSLLHLLYHSTVSVQVFPLEGNISPNPRSVTVTLHSADETYCNSSRNLVVLSGRNGIPGSIIPTLLFSGLWYVLTINTSSSVSSRINSQDAFRITEKGYIKSRFLDDKLSVAILLGYAKYLKEENITPSRPVYQHITVYEEVGHGGSASVPEGVTDILSVDMGCVGDGLECKEHQVSICVKDSGGPYSYDFTGELIAAAKANGIDYAADVYPHYGSDVEATLRGGADARQALILPGVYASHGYERSHVDGVKNTLELLAAYLDK